MGVHSGSAQRHIFKGIVTDLEDTFGNLDIGQAPAVAEGTRFNADTAFGHRDFFQSIAVVEQVPFNPGDIGGEGHFRQCVAVLESVDTDAGDAVGNINVIHVLAVGERLITDVGNALANEDEQNFIAVAEPGGSGGGAAVDLGILEIAHGAGAPDVQVTGVVQRPADVPTAFTAVHNGGTGIAVELCISGTAVVGGVAEVAQINTVFGAGGEDVLAAR